MGNLLRRQVHFLGATVVSLLIRGLGVGILLYAVELGFAYGIQAFLLELGVAARASMQIPRWIPQTSLQGVLVFLIAVAVFRGLLQWAQVYMQGAALEQFKQVQRSRLLSWLYRSESASSQRIMSLFGERSNLAGAAIMQFQASVVQVTASIMLGASLLWMAPQVTLVAGALLGLLVFPALGVAKRIRKSGLGLAKEWESVNGRLVMGIKNLLLLRIYGMEQSEENLAQSNLVRYLDHSLGYYNASGVLFAVPQVIGLILICGIALLSRTYAQINPGILLSYFYLFIRLLQNVSGFSNTASNLMFNWPQLKQLFAWWEEAKTSAPPSFSGVPPQPLIESNSPKQAIGFRLNQVRHRYPLAQKDTLQVLNLEFKPGQAVVITGASGSGKSTLLGILLGELKPHSGTVDVFWDGRYAPLVDRRKQLLSCVGYVGPESFLLEGTIYDNLVYGLAAGFNAGLPTEPRTKLLMSDVAIRDAIESAQCQFVYGLQDGLNHRLTEQGQGLSAGQKQRLSLARALLRRPKVLFLDEATANLDSETERMLVSTFESLKGRITLIAVTHRSEIQRIADQLVNLDLGKAI